ncbi:hypothetical protein TTRE_0000919901 [Trichuris trichiura]|uniref:CCHC-type domain-containing protein n=1 Tax=Trichuris trichiura TaxID=36087 RepID=A0A077ZKD0_TRITR|nr:hypothetical protein TTRE_0000919901 [Trichuris trichiura]
MTTAHHGNLEPFNVSTGVDGWEDWLERFQFFADANSISEERRCGLLFTYGGPELYRLMKEAVAPDEPGTKTMEQLTETVRARFDPVPGIYPARAEFYARKQRPGESVSNFLASLRHLARRSQFEAAPTVTDEADLRILDQFLIGMADTKTRRRILRGKKISLKELYNAALAGEAAVEQSNLMDKHSALLPQATFCAVDKEHQTRTSKQPAVGRANCWRCNNKGHSPDLCRFKELCCHRCHKKGHISRVCRNGLPRTNANPTDESLDYRTVNRSRRRVHAMARSPSQEWQSPSDSEDDQPSEHVRVSAFKVNAMAPDQSVGPPTVLSMIVNGVLIEFEVDSGSALTLISEELLHRLWKGSLPGLKRSSLKIRTWSQERMTVQGSFQAAVQFKSVKCNLELFVMRNGGRPLLGRAWFRSFNIAISVPSYQLSVTLPYVTANDGWQRIIEKYSEVFQPDLGQ